MRATFSSAIFLLAFPCLFPVSAGASTTTLKGVDLYRSSAVTLPQARAAAAPFLDSYLRLRAEGRAASDKSVARLKGQIEAKLRRLPGVAFADIVYNEYVTSAERTAYLTFDIVDAADVKARMPFAAAPSGHVADPQGLLASWWRYAEAGEVLARKGLLSSSEHPSCPGFYCLWGSPTPELKQLEQAFVAGAQSSRGPLLSVLVKEADPRKRAAAVFVLSYLSDARAVVDLSFGALKDPSEEVRAAGLQVLSEIATYHKALFIDAGKIVPLLDYPTVSDRARVLSVLVGLADNPNYKAFLASRASPALLGLLRLKQPSNHDLAYTVLAIVSQESYDRRDYPSWSRWVEGHSSKGAAAMAAGVSSDGE